MCSPTEPLDGDDLTCIVDSVTHQLLEAILRRDSNRRALQQCEKHGIGDLALHTSLARNIDADMARVARLERLVLKCHRLRLAL